MLNSTAAVLLEDIFKGCFNGKPTDKVAGLIVKGSILALGALAMMFLFVVEKLGGILGVCIVLLFNFYMKFSDDINQAFLLLFVM